MSKSIKMVKSPLKWSKSIENKKINQIFVSINQSLTFLNIFEKNENIFDLFFMDFERFS